MKRATKSLIVFILTLAMLMSFVPASTFAATKTYHAYMGIQTNPTLWIFRNGYGDKTYGGTTKEFKTGLFSTTSKTSYAGKFTDVAIKKDGTYTVKLSNPDFQSETRLSILMVSSNIPVSKKIKVTNVKVKIDGSTKKTFATAVIDPESKKYVKILCLNDWNTTVKDCFTYPFPMKSIEITFTIKGLK